MKEHTISLVMGETLIKTPMRYYFSPTGLAKIKKPDTVKVLVRVRIKCIFYTVDRSVNWYNHFGEKQVECSHTF